MSFSHVKIKDSTVDEALLVVWNFLNENYSLYKQTYGAFVADVSFSDGNYVIRRNGEVIFFMNYVSDGLRHLVVNLMAGNSRRAIMMAIGLSMNVILNKGHDGLVFHVNVNNTNMLRLVRHAGMEETNALRPGLRSFRCTTSRLIKTFGSLYHRFLMILPAYNIEFFRCISDVFYIANGWESIKSRHLLLGHDRKPIVYLKEYDVSFHGSPDLLQHLFDSEEEDGISLSIKDYLSKNGIISNTKIDEKNNYKPVDAIFLPTSSCNLGCRYCYSEAIPNNKSILDFEKAKIGIDFVFNNATDRGVRHVSFSFLGGGEPMMVAELDCRLVDYIRQKEKQSGIFADISVCTNGTIYNDSVHRLLGMSNRVQFSFDGSSDVQNLQRPFAGGRPTYETVVSNILRVRESFPDVIVNVRATVSDYSVSMMSAFVKLLSELHVKSVSFEPLIVTGRALQDASLRMPDINLFTHHFIEAYEFGAECDVEVNCSASAVFRKYSFCGATYNNFVITPEGLVSTCVEVSSLHDPLSEIFIIGDISEGRVRLDVERLSKIRKYDEDVRVECLNCISHKSCRGNCPVRTLRFQNSGEKYINELCVMQTKLLCHHIALLHEKQER